MGRPRGSLGKAKLAELKKSEKSVLKPAPILKHQSSEVKDVVLPVVFPNAAGITKEEVENAKEKKEEKEAVKPVLKNENVQFVKKCSHHPSCQCQDKLSAGQTFFEDGPSGTHIIGDDVQQRIMWHAGNGGKGAWILRKR
jgi:hypothetical protein